MLRRILGSFGLLPSFVSSGGAGGYDGQPNGDGEATISFVPGVTAATLDAEEAPDERLARVTDRDQVWPGKTETIQIVNPESIAYRFNLTVTDLDPSFYVRRPPIGGTPQPGGGVLLMPGEEATFEVTFLLPPAGDKTRTRTFSVVLTCFDPRRTSDAGEIVQDMPLRWVALPSADDLRLTSTPPQLIIRPWRPAARFDLLLQNRSLLPAELGLQLLHAPRKEALTRNEAEPVAVISQTLAARTPGLWHCQMPPYSQRASYFATATGTAEVGDGQRLPVSLPRPLYVRYVPWLRMGRDWLFLFACLLALFWLVWGVPVRKQPVVRLQIAFAGLSRGQTPPESRLQDLHAQMILLDEQGHDLEQQAARTGVVRDGAFEFTGPTRWYGFRWISGGHIAWNGAGRQPQYFRIAVSPDADKQSAFRRWDLNAAAPVGRLHDGLLAYEAADAPKPGGDWTTFVTLKVPQIHGARVLLSIGDFGALTGRTPREITVNYTLDGQPYGPLTFRVERDVSGRLRPILLDLTDRIDVGSSAEFSVKATAEGFTSEEVQAVEVSHREKPLTVVLTFPKHLPNPVPAVATPAAVSPPKGPILSASVPTIPVPKAQGNPGPVTGSTRSRSDAAPAGGGRPHPAMWPLYPTVPEVIPPRSASPGSNPHPLAVNRPVPPPGQAVQARAEKPGPAVLTLEVLSPTGIQLSWGGAEGATHFAIYRSRGFGAAANTFKSIHVVTGQTYTDKGLKPGTIYTYMIKAANGAGGVSFSNRAQARTQIYRHF